MCELKSNAERMSLVFARAKSYKSAAVAGYCGAILLIDGMGGYVLTAVVTFIIATVITVMCIKIKNRRDRK